MVSYQQVFIQTAGYLCHWSHEPDLQVVAYYDGSQESHAISEEHHLHYLCRYRYGSRFHPRRIHCRRYRNNDRSRFISCRYWHAKDRLYCNLSSPAPLRRHYRETMMPATSIPI